MVLRSVRQHPRTAPAVSPEHEYGHHRRAMAEVPCNLHPVTGWHLGRVGSDRARAARVLRRLCSGLVPEERQAETLPGQAHVHTQTMERVHRDLRDRIMIEAIIETIKTLAISALIVWAKREREQR